MSQTERHIGEGKTCRTKGPDECAGWMCWMNMPDGWHRDLQLTSNATTIALPVVSTRTNLKTLNDILDIAMIVTNDKTCQEWQEGPDEQTRQENVLGRCFKTIARLTWCAVWPNGQKNNWHTYPTYQTYEILRETIMNHYLRYGVEETKRDSSCKWIDVPGNGHLLCWEVPKGFAMTDVF